MSNLSGTKGSEKSRVFETVLSSPGMTEKCRITLTISRQNILLLGRLIESGLLSEKGKFEDDLVTTLPPDSIEEFRTIHEEILKKGDLSNLYERLRLL